MPAWNQSNKSKTLKNGGIQCYCVMCKKAGMSDRKYMLHSDENWFGKRSDQESLKNGLEVKLGNRYAAVKQFNKVDNNSKRQIKFLNN